MLKEQKDAHLSRAMTMYGDYLLRVCFTYVKDWTVAEDLVQDTFVKYYEKWSNFVKKLPSKHIYIELRLTIVTVIFQDGVIKIQVIDYWSKFKSLSIILKSIDGRDGCIASGID